MRYVLAAILILALSGFAGSLEQAEAHPLPKGTSVTVGLHKICKTVLICRDKAPQPKINCWWGNRGMTEEIYDPKLDALVTWRCQCPWGEYGRCFWTRVSFRPVPPEWMLPPNSHHVWDWQRRCASLVCLGFRVDHFYRSLRYFPGRVASGA